MKFKIFSRNDDTTNMIHDGIYFHGEIEKTLGTHQVFSSFNTRISKGIEIKEYPFIKDDIYDVYIIFNNVKYDLKLYYWRIKNQYSAPNSILHRGLVILPKDKEAKLYAQTKFKHKSISL